MLENGSLKYTYVPLPVAPQPSGMLPFGVQVPVSSPANIADSPSIAFIPGNLQTIMIESTDSRVANYEPTVDNKTVPGQLGPYATLVQDGLWVTVTLPPDIASFISSTPPFEKALALLEALLSRIETWSRTGCINCSRICRAISRILATYQDALLTSRVYGETLDIHIYVAIVKSIFSSSATLFGGRAYEAVGTQSPLLQKASEDAVNSVLNADIYTVLPDGSKQLVKTYDDMGNFLATGGKVILQRDNLVGEILDSIVRGVMVV